MDLLYATADARPDQEAVVHGDQRLTNAELVQRVERLAGGLASRGIGPGDAVALLLANDPDFVASFWAITALGAVVVPLNSQFKQDELAFSFRECGVRAVISDERTAGVCERIVAGWERPAEIITTSAAHGQATTLDELVRRQWGDRLSPRGPDEPFVYQFSSGSTGRPKRVMRTHANCRAEAESYASMGITAEDRILCTVPLFHTYGMGCCLFSAARTGATLVILEDPNPFLLQRHRALELIERERPTVFPGVPFNYRLMAEAPRESDLSSLRWCFSAGTALPRASFDAFMERFAIPVRQLYGCTEAGTLTANLDDDPISTAASVGAPVGDVRVEIVDDEGRALRPGEEGEIRVTSPALTAGYVGHEALNAEVFRDGGFLTGDLGRLDDAGRLFITGRKKLLIEVGGYKVDPIEVQDVVQAHPKVREAVVVGVPGRVEGEELVKAVVVPADDCQEREIVQFCQEHLANYKAPQVVEFRDEIPKNPMGKILRKYLV